MFALRGGDARGSKFRCFREIGSRNRRVSVMQLITTSLGALAVAVIFYTYREYLQVQLRRQRCLRERVAYMLWVMANPELEKSVP